MLKSLNKSEMSCTSERYLLFLADDLPKDAKCYLMDCIENHRLVVEEEQCPDHSVLVVGASFGMLAEEVWACLKRLL